MLSAAVKAGADAVYFGLKEFSMRQSAKNFSIRDLERINKICGKKIKKYLTVNTIIYDNELEKLEEIIKKIKGKVDAIICWDLSVIELCKKYKIPFHISTQASISNTSSAKFYKSLGAERIILARELNLKQIKEISKTIKIETFIHGAMCVSISGRCFTSQFLFNCSANRGLCLQPCRRSYTIKDEDGNELKLENNRVMSAKDLCTLPFIEKLKKAGIICFKIEGRNRDPRYVDTVIRAYRKALDKKLNKKEIQESLEELGRVYNRKFSSGFYLKLPTSDDFTNIEHSASTEQKKFIGKILHYYPKLKVGIMQIQAGELKLGDELNIIGNTTGIEKIKISSIEIKNHQVQKAIKGQEIGIKLPRVRPNDEVYLIKKRIKGIR